MNWGEVDNDVVHGELLAGVCHAIAVRQPNLVRLFEDLLFVDAILEAGVVFPGDTLILDTVVQIAFPNTLEYGTALLQVLQQNGLTSAR